ncbi:MAG: hypothetical protein U0V56_10220 [Actinomycetota bacterium]
MALPHPRAVPASVAERGQLDHREGLVDPQAALGLRATFLTISP